MNRRSLRFQLLVWYTALLGGVFALFAFFVYAALDHFLEDTLRKTLQRNTGQIVRSIVSKEGKVTGGWLGDEIEAHYAPENSGRFMRVTLMPTNVLYVSGSPKDGSFDARDIPLAAERPDESFRSVSLPDARQIMLKGLFVEKEGERFFVEVGVTKAQIIAVTKRMMVSLLVSVPILITVAASGAYVLVGRALEPVDRMARSAERISIHNLDERLPVTQSGDELETLSLALNGMILRINEAYEYTRRFIADASHELRTPLTILRGELENMLNHKQLSAEARATIGSNLEEVERLGKIVEGLFALSRLDAGEAQAETVRFDLSALAKSTTEQMSLLAEDKGVSLVCEERAAVPVVGDRARLKQVIVNLVDNAIKYTASPGTVTVRTSVSAANAILEVRDNGIGIPSSALPHIFERFYRVDKGRSRNLGGAGLGLPIVKSICSAHHGVVEVESQEGVGSCFRVKLPLAGAIAQNGTASTG